MYKQLKLKFIYEAVLCFNLSSDWKVSIKNRITPLFETVQESNLKNVFLTESYRKIKLQFITILLLAIGFVWFVKIVNLKKKIGVTRLLSFTLKFRISFMF